jgi:hypothetical protein
MTCLNGGGGISTKIRILYIKCRKTRYTIRKRNLDTHKENDINSGEQGRDDLSRMYGPKCEQGMHSMRSSVEVQSARKSADIVTAIGIEGAHIRTMILSTKWKAGLELGDPG